MIKYSLKIKTFLTRDFLGMRMDDQNGKNTPKHEIWKQNNFQQVIQLVQQRIIELIKKMKQIKRIHTTSSSWSPRGALTMYDTPGCCFAASALKEGISCMILLSYQDQVLA
jgi:hypothetical protein